MHTLSNLPREIKETTALFSCTLVLNSTKKCRSWETVFYCGFSCRFLVYFYLAFCFFCEKWLSEQRPTIPPTPQPGHLPCPPPTHPKKKRKIMAWKCKDKVERKGMWMEEKENLISLNFLLILTEIRATLPKMHSVVTS